MIDVLCHSSIRIEEDKIIYVDPFKIEQKYNDADYILWNGNRPQIKRKKFEEYIDRHNLI